MAVTTDSIRNVVLVGHNGNGKTSLAEAMLYRAGVVGRPGRVDDGTTICDSDAEEKQRHQSLALSTATFMWQDHKINLIDTPGYADFVGDAVAGMHAAELAVFVIDSVSGVQAQDLQLWRRAEQMKLPRMIFVNGLDRDNSSFQRTLTDLRVHFGSHTEPVELPIGAESEFHGIADLLTDHAFVYDTGHAEETPVPDDIADAEQKGHEHLIEEVVEGDDEILEQYLEGTEPTAEQLEKLLHDAVDTGTVFPVLCGSATTPIAVDHLMTFICNVGPAPGDLGPVTVEAGEEPVDVDIDAKGKTLAYVFKTRVDEFLGQLSYLKVLSGTINTDDVLVNSRTRDKERLHQLISLSGSDHTSIRQIIAGDIAAVAKLSDAHTGDTLAPAGSPVTVSMPSPPSPVYGVAVHATTPAHEDRLATVLRRLVLEDPSLAVSYEQSTRQTILSGGGEAHIRVALSRVARAGVEIDTEDVRVAYLETLARPIELESRFKKQSGGHGQFAVATVRFEPLARGTGFRVRERGHRWRHSAQSHPRGGGRSPGIDVDRRRPRFPNRRSAGRLCRRQAPFGRLIGDGLQDGRVPRAERCSQDRRYRGARTHKRDLGPGPRRSPGRRPGRPEQPTGAGPRHRAGRYQRRDHDPRPRSHVGDHVLRHRSALDDRGHGKLRTDPLRLPGAPGRDAGQDRPGRRVNAPGSA